jgi:DNA replication protein DnaC
MASKKPTVLLDHYLKQLRMPTMLREYQPTAQACAKENKNNIDFLLRLVERETFEREQRASERRIRAAKFPVLKTLDTFDFKAMPGINKELIIDLMRGDYIEGHENILFLGNPGTGKTHLSTALGHATCAQGK